MTSPPRPLLTLLLTLSFSSAALSACGFCQGEDDTAEVDDKKDDGEASKGDKKGDKGDKGDKKGDKSDKGDKKASASKGKVPTPKDLRKPLDKLPHKGSALNPAVINPSLKNIKIPNKDTEMDFTGDKNLEGDPVADNNPGGKPQRDPQFENSPPAVNLEDLPPAPQPDRIAGNEGKRLDIGNPITRADVKDATGYRGILRPGELIGIEPDANYNATRLKPNSRDRFGVSLQVWRETNPGAQSRRFNDLLRQYPASQRNRDIGDSAFLASWGGLNYVVWLNRKSRFIAVIACSDDICQDGKAAMALAQRVDPRITKY